jgi:hypothetical protein
LIILWRDKASSSWFLLLPRLHHRYNLWSSDRTLFPNPAAVRTTDRAAEDVNSNEVEKLQRKKNSARSKAHPRKKIVKNMKKCGLQSRACLLALLVGEYLFEAFH